MPAYDSKDACSIAQITSRQLNHWDRLGIVNPSVDPGRGSGNRRAYRLTDLIMLRLAGELRKFGVSLDVLVNAIAAARRAWTDRMAPESTAAVLTITSNGEVTVGREIESAIEETSTSAIVVRLDRIARQTQKLAGRRAESPLVRVIEVGGRSFQTVVVPVEKSRNFDATCNAFPGARGRGETIDAAFQDLQREITHGSTRKDHSVAADRTATRRRGAKASAHSPRASAWGDAW